MDGEAIFLFIYDVGTRLESAKIKGILSNAVDFSSHEHDKAVPEEIASFNIPAIFNLKEQEIVTPQMKIRVRPQVSIYEIGAFSVRIRVPLERVELSKFNKLTSDPEIQEKIKGLVKDIREKTEKVLSKIATIKSGDLMETYRVYFVRGDKDAILKPNEKLIAGLLLDEENYSLLDNKYVESTLHRQLSYYKTDVAIVDWDGMFMVASNRKYEHELLTAEIANVQLLELRIYHDEIDKIVKAASNEFVGITHTGFFKSFFSRRHLTKLSLELGNFYDSTKDVISSTNNIIYGFGEWYLARLYSSLSDSFRLMDWNTSLSQDLEIVEKLRAFIQDRVEEDTSSNLEAIVIALILIEIGIEVITLLKI